MIACRFSGLMDDFSITFKALGLMTISIPPVLTLALSIGVKISKLDYGEYLEFEKDEYILHKPWQNIGRRRNNDCVFRQNGDFDFKQHVFEFLPASSEQQI